MREQSAQRPEMREFIRFILSRGDLVAETGYLPLPKQAYAVAQKHFDDGRLGSVFAGKPRVGITIDELLAMEARL